eukprot:c17530_g1_i1.p1 GENE.c17530_g1_i1~~c17530_g1_i1.p1  ORF type:complete len:198 (+),score=73.93 c17530_g1_i1:127-720(+)
MTGTSIKCVVVGDGAVGKTCLLLSYTTNSFAGEYAPTVFDNYSVSVMVGSCPLNIGFWDTAGQDDYDKLRPLSYPQTDVFIICFSISSRDSFLNVQKKWIPELINYDPCAKIVLIGTKSDLSSKLRTVRREEAEILVKKFGLFGYTECSSKTSEGVQDAFNIVIRTALAPNPLPLRRKNFKSAIFNYLIPKKKKFSI